MRKPLVGHTPLIDLSHLLNSKTSKLLVKCEFFNQSLSLKDRMVSHIIETAERLGKLTTGQDIVCSTSGNTGCSVSMIAASKGYHSIIITSDNCSPEKVSFMEAFGSKILKVDHSKYVKMGSMYAHEYGCFDINQYDNPLNPDAYYRTLGPEIWEATSGAITHFVMTGSTYGCISGTSRFLKEMKPSVKTILVDPVGSKIYDYYYGYQMADVNNGSIKPSIIEGAGKSSPTGCLDTSVIDRVVQVPDISAISICRSLALYEGLLVGGSSGLNLSAAISIANSLNESGVVVTILCDSGIKYLTKIYNDNYLEEHGISLT
jgi:cysteine synthase